MPRTSCEFRVSLWAVQSSGGSLQQYNVSVDPRRFRATIPSFMLCQSIDLLAPIVTSVAAPRIIAQPALRLYFGFAFALCVALRSQSPLIAWTFSYSFRSHDEETTSPVNGAVRSRHAAACLSPVRSGSGTDRSLCTARSSGSERDSCD